ncbi:S-adenosyl-L-methionine-dependent methyltransferase [Amniculicola lignicola CBS 123094]|uniref:S-adenosyl-L-methionine-dependent methyltransferase n=1 Tax=Amniculicola lignicola CBS 123094 TaxID=1392246 RepID=A0A6A5WBA4_9PLEO|nr:S-adenosyl-L-methionine-dependent methyltransferase [Amniculicola lignicola CBS 123094]
MSLYYEAAAVLANADKVGGSLKSRLYKQKDLKSSPAQIFALVAESSKWSIVLRDVVEKSGLLTEEKKLTPVLALLLAHDLLLKNGIVAPANHVLKLAINRHKARLQAEFTKTRIRLGYSTVAALKEAVRDGALEDSPENAVRHPRWVRINTLKTTLAEQLATTFAGYQKTEDLAAILTASGNAKILLEDPHIPNLLALPSKADLSKSSAYTKGQIIFQDKASCFPAYLLNASPEDGDVVDGCAAPGNKTTHLAAICSERSQLADALAQGVVAFEKDPARALILKKMVKLASADKLVSIKASSDFLAAKAGSNEFANVGALLLDPSCSGSGIVGRDDIVKLHLPSASLSANTDRPQSKGKKRKREPEKETQPDTDATLQLETDDTAPEETPLEGKLAERLQALSTFQRRILEHAMRFPNARKITYSTCSIYFEENESVVFNALASTIAKERGWRILKREDQVEGMRNWKKRGVWEDGKMEDNLNSEMKVEALEGCIRCEKATEDGTMGFFVAAFTRDGGSRQDVLQMTGAGDDEDEEWNGFSDAEIPTPAPELMAQATGKTRKKKKKHMN